ncbi:MAG: Autolysin [Chloroflexi bacterium]|nr:Autolysin [Chloroflexota bacterium]
MSPDTNSENKKICPTCGTKIKADAERCLVCGSKLNGSKKDAEEVVKGSRMPKITVGLPIAIILVTLFLAIGAGIVYLALQQTGQVVEQITVTPTPTQTSTPTITPTPATPTATGTPLPTPTPLTYTIAAGDSCLTIAARFEVSIQSIVLLNDIPASCDTLYEGQTLLIPHPTPTASPYPTATLSGLDATRAACETVNYEVQEGDTLSTISQNYAVPMAAIKDYNGLVSNTVYSGLTLVVPLCERAATPGPSPTPTPPPPYPAPNLLLPSDGSYFSLEDTSVSLQWSSVGLINENEAYMVTVEDVTEGEGRKLVDYPTDTKFTVPSSFRPTKNEPHVYRWWVTTVRQVDVDEEGNPVWEEAGETSETRVFTWTGEVAPEASPTP